jgi:hypothetical protein
MATLKNQSLKQIQKELAEEVRLCILVRHF